MSWIKTKSLVLILGLENKMLFLSLILHESHNGMEPHALKFYKLLPKEALLTDAVFKIRKYERVLRIWAYFSRAYLLLTYNYKKPAPNFVKRPIFFFACLEVQKIMGINPGVSKNRFWCTCTFNNAMFFSFKTKAFSTEFLLDFISIHF